MKKCAGLRFGPCFRVKVISWPNLPCSPFPLFDDIWMQVKELMFVKFLQAQAQRLLLVGSTAVHHPLVSQHMILPQNEHLSVFPQATEPEDTVDYINVPAGLSNDGEPVSLQASDYEVEEVASQRVMDFVACHGATPAQADTVNDSSSTLAEIFRCFICLGKVGWFIFSNHYIEQCRIVCQVTN